MRYGSWKRLGWRVLGFGIGFGLLSVLLISLVGGVVASVTSDPPTWAIVGLAAGMSIGLFSALRQWGREGWLGGLCVAVIIAAIGGQLQQSPHYPTGPAMLLGTLVGAIFALLKRPPKIPDLPDK